MSTRADNELLSDLAERLRAEDDIVIAIAFGSAARGRLRPHKRSARYRGLSPLLSAHLTAAPRIVDPLITSNRTQQNIATARGRCTQ
jgi:hypothetical protein